MAYQKLPQNYFSKKYLTNKDEVDKELLLKYKSVIECHDKYNDKLRERIESTLKEINNKKEINIDCLIDQYLYEFVYYIDIIKI